MMQPRMKWHPEVTRLTRILDAEAKGEPFDCDEGVRLATLLRDLCPSIAGSLSGIADRMGRADQRR